MDAPILTVVVAGALAVGYLVGRAHDFIDEAQAYVTGFADGLDHADASCPLADSHHDF